jgi:DNA-directed RNA polymerase subunit M/transcription elongation factor TFIIS
MNNSEIHFCGECHNMTYLYTNEEDKLIHYCKSCTKSEPFSSENNCIYSIDFKKYDNSESINHNQYITHDITLPKLEGNHNIKCTNEECISLTEEKESSVTYIKYDLEEMKYIYICNHCGQKWKNN